LIPSTGSTKLTTRRSGQVWINERNAKGGNGEKGVKGVKSEKGVKGVKTEKGVKGVKTGKKTPFGEETPSFVKSTPSHAKGDDDGAAMRPAVNGYNLFL